MWTVAVRPPLGAKARRARLQDFQSVLPARTAATQAAAPVVGVPREHGEPVGAHVGGVADPVHDPTGRAGRDVPREGAVRPPRAQHHPLLVEVQHRGGAGEAAAHDARAVDGAPDAHHGRSPVAVDRGATWLPSRESTWSKIGTPSSSTVRSPGGRSAERVEAAAAVRVAGGDDVLVAGRAQQGDDAGPDGHPDVTVDDGLALQVGTDLVGAPVELGGADPGLGHGAPAGAASPRGGGDGGTTRRGRRWCSCASRSLPSGDRAVPGVTRMTPANGGWLLSGDNWFAGPTAPQ